MLIRQTIYVTVDSSVWFYLKSILVCRKGKTGEGGGGNGAGDARRKEEMGREMPIVRPAAT